MVSNHSIRNRYFVKLEIFYYFQISQKWTNILKMFDQTFRKIIVRISYLAVKGWKVLFHFIMVFSCLCQCFLVSDHYFRLFPKHIYFFHDFFDSLYSSLIDFYRYYGFRLKGLFRFSFFNMPSYIPKSY